MSGNPVDQVLSWAVDRPSAAAIVSTDLTMTFAELGDATRRTAARLRQRGVRPGHTVGIRARPEWEAVLALAVMHEGAVSLHASDAILRAHSSLLDWQLGESPVGSPAARRVVSVDDSFIESLGAVSPMVDSHTMSGDDLCRVVFSSGTTGTPKGIAFSTDTLRARTDSARSNWMPSDPFFCLLGIDTVSGFQTFAWSALHGRPWIVPSGGAGNLELLARTAATSIKTSPARLAELLDALEAAERTPSIALETVQVAGSLLSGALARRCRSLLGVDPVYLYGSTEAGTITRGLVDAANPALVGHVVDGAELRIVDDSGQAVDDVGAIGHVEYRTPSTATQYWHGGDADLAFRDGWFRPGDRGAFDAHGRLELAGRIDDLVNAGGSKINLAHLDLHLAEVDELHDAASFSFDTHDGLRAIGVVYVPRTDIDPAALARLLRDRFSTITISALVRVDTIPRNARGKVSRESLSRVVGEQ